MSSGHQLVLCSFWPAERSEAGLPVGARSRRPFPSSRVVCLLLRHSGGPSRPTVRSPRRRYRMSLGRGFAATGRQPAGAEAGCAEEGAPGRAHRAGRRARRTAPSTPWTGRAIAAPGPPSSQPPGRVAAPHHCRLLPEVSTRPPSNPPLRDASASLHRAPVLGPGTCCPGAAGTQENNGSGPSTQSAPFSRHPEPRHSSTRLLGPAGVSQLSRLHHFLRSPPRG